MNGKLDDIGIWNHALTQEEVTALYNASYACAPQIKKGLSYSDKPLRLTK
jgi:hypothetical protein